MLKEAGFEAIDYSFIEDNYLEYDDCGDICDDRDLIQKAYIYGAKYSDENPKNGLIDINKAREWVKNAFLGPFGEGLANSIANEFVKAMMKE